MGSTYGRKVLSESGRGVQVAADMQDFIPKVGGITLAWDLIAAAVGIVTLLGGLKVRDGAKYLRLGQILCKITQAETQTVDLSGADDPTGGTFSMTILGQTIAGIAYNVSAAALQTLIRALDVPNASGVTVQKTGFVYTITFPPSAGNVSAITVNSTGLTSGGTVTVNIATTTQGVENNGKFGPYDPSATDGRQNLTRGNCFILNKSILEEGIVEGLNTSVTDHPQVFDGGTVWKERILMTTGTHSLAAGPTVAEFEAAFPRITYVQ